MPEKGTAKHPCARCGKKQPAERLIFSSHTRRRYCADFKSCDRRVAKKARKAVAV